MSKRDERDEPRVISAQNSPTCCVFAVETVFSVRVCGCASETEGECICVPSLILCTNTTTTLLEVLDS